MLLIPAEQLVARLPVYRSLVSLVAVSDSLFGAAHSDPYLSCARPAPSLASLASVAALAAKLNGGALVVGLPFGAAAGMQEERADAEERQRRTLAALLREPALARSGLMACAFAPAQQITAACAAQLYRDNVLWDQTGVLELGKQGEAADASVMAAVSLQLFLDEHCGGWANTFG
jgi:hypothetical protein